MMKYVNIENVLKNRRLPAISLHAPKTKWKKRSEETQTLRADCIKVEPKNFARRRPPSPGRGTAKI